MSSNTQQLEKDAERIRKEAIAMYREAGKHVLLNVLTADKLRADANTIEKAAKKKIKEAKRLEKEVSYLCYH